MSLQVKLMVYHWNSFIDDLPYIGTYICGQYLSFFETVLIYFQKKIFDQKSLFQPNVALL